MEVLHATCRVLHNRSSSEWRIAMHLSLGVESAWIVLALVWAVAALGVRRTARSESPGSRLAYTPLLWVAFMLLFVERWRPGPLGWRFVPAGPEVAALGA